MVVLLLVMMLTTVVVMLMIQAFMTMMMGSWIPQRQVLVGCIAILNVLGLSSGSHACSRCKRVEGTSHRRCC